MAPDEKRIYWHRELPPLGDQIENDHWIEAKSDPVPYTYTHDMKMWGKCQPSLDGNLTKRLVQEIERQGGHCAHILDERVKRKIDHVNNLCWLEGQYGYVLYFAPDAKLPNKTDT